MEFNRINLLAAIKSNFSFKYLALIFICACLIFLPDIVYFLHNNVFNYLLIGLFIVPVLLLIPVFFFSYRLRIYYYVLAFLAAFTPIAILPVLLINSQANAEMLGMILDTNYHEVIELLGWRIVLVITCCVLFFLTFIWIGKLLPKRISFKKGFVISFLALTAFMIVPLLRTTALYYYPQILKNTFKTYYPFRIFNAAEYLSNELKNVSKYKKATENFSFGGKRTDSARGRQIHILLIGETARYDHWGLNGYERETSPYLSKNKSLISFSDVSSGGTMTVISVPLIISRADATDYEGHKKEKSILGAFKEVGYRSYWVSNQSKFGLSGNIGMHYTDGDTAIFNGWGSNESNFNGNTDSALVPMIHQILLKEKENDIFLLVHMIGSHWRYLLRYPKEFSKFQPVSDDNRMMMGYPPKEVMINEYDNSILFTDYIIHQIIEEVRSTNTAATVTYVSDHGENFRDDERKLYFHGYNPTKYTAKVPLFIWTSDAYQKENKIKVNNLLNHKDSAISSAGNLFYTLIDLGGIEISKSDPSKSIGSSFFRNDPQMVLGENGKILKFKNIR